jgi:cytochrome c-type protein NapC
MTAEGSRILWWVAIACAATAATILIAYLVRRPPLTAAVKLLLFFGVGALPIGAAVSGNLVGYEVSKRRTFCASCHTMLPYTRDAASFASRTLAALHSRNHRFGDESCYVCHRDYGLFGGMTTKLDGLQHVRTYYLGTPPARPRLYRPYPNANCVHCHSMTLPGFQDEPEHAAVAEELRRDEIGCASDGCHGPAHGAAEGTP